MSGRKQRAQSEGAEKESEWKNAESTERGGEKAERERSAL